MEEMSPTLLDFRIRIGNEIGATTNLQGHTYSKWEMERSHGNRRSKHLLCVAMCQAAKEAVWPKGLLKDLVIDLKTLLILVATVRVRIIPSFIYALALDALKHRQLIPFHA